MTQKILTREFLRSDTALLAALALLKLLIHFYTNAFAGYGIFRDELYYIACSDHLAMGYVDHPPFSIFLLMIYRLLFGDSLFALRLLPAIAGAFTVFITGLIARELGGGRFAQALAALATIASAIKLAMDTFYSMNSFDHLFWALVAYTLIQLIKNEHPKTWLLLGLILGLGLLNKIGVAWLGAGLFVGMLLTEQRTWFKTRWPWIAGTTAFLLFLPFIIWNLTHDFAHFEFIRNASGDKYSSQTPITFIAGQLLINNPVTLPVWLSGLFFFFFHQEGKRFKLLGIIYLTAFVILIINGHSKPEYLASAYAILFAGGGVMIERFAQLSLRWMRYALIVLLTASGITLAPAVIPILPLERYIRYADALGITPSTAESKELDKLPQFYADMFGWEDKAKAVAGAYNKLSPEEKQKCAIFADNYGRCAAIDFFGKKYGLPKSIGNHNNYWIWGPGEYTGELVLILGGNLEGKQERFESVEVVGAVSSEYSMPYENNLRIYLCRGLKVPLNSVWYQLKHYD